MKLRSLYYVLIVLVALFGVSVANAGEAVCQADSKQVAEPLISNGFFEVINATTIQFEVGVDWEVVKTKDDREIIRYGIDGKDGMVVAGGIECRCNYPDVCPDDTCATSTTGGNAKCRGGCYREDGTVCNSCSFQPVIVGEQ